jgi:hypothetical protein
MVEVILEEKSEKKKKKKKKKREERAFCDRSKSEKASLQKSNSQNML